MTSKEAYIFGWMFGAIQRADGMSDIGGDLTLACQRPYSASAKIVAEAMRKGLMRDELDQQITQAMNEINNIEPPMAGGSEKMQSIENQGSWQLGYFAGKAGKPVSMPLDIAAARRAKGLSQVQLAQQMGVDQALVSRWESGKVTPTEENLAKLRAILL